MLKKKSFFLVILLYMLFAQDGWTQVYPVQVNTHLTPPFSLKLSDFATTNSEKLIVQALMIDVNETSRQLRFRLTIKGNGLQIRSNDFIIGAAPIFIDGGVPLRLSNLDLRPYFELRNLSGITPQQYNNPLPDGNYQFCFEVFDWISGQRLSSAKLGCFNAFLIINDPPFLNLPRRGDLVESKNPQNILFNWTPRHLNANGVQYEFELREVWDTQIDPQAAFLASPNLYSTTTFNTTLLYGPGETTLLENKTYAWRVRAVVTDGISETSVFRNNGYSEIYYFTYTADCQSPQFALAKSLSTSSEEITWLPNPDHLRYRVQYRKKGVRDAVWFEANTVNPYTTLHNLEAGTTYEYRVGAQCINTLPGQDPSPLGGGWVGAYNAVQEFTTPAKSGDSHYNCGIAPEVSITNREPLDNIGANEVFTAGDFPVTIKRIDPSPLGGGWEGAGYIVVPYLADTKIAVEFNNIRINTDYQLYEGKLYTTYDANWGNVDDIQDEIDAVAELANTISELLNLDIDKTTKENIEALVGALMENIKGEDLPEELVSQVEEATNNMIEAKQRYDGAVSTGDTQAASQAQEGYKNAQQSLNEANEEIEKIKKEAADLLKKAIKELYREGRDSEVVLTNIYEQISQRIVNNYKTEDDDFFIIESVKAEGEPNQNLNNTLQQELNEIEQKIGIYLFAKVLSTEETNNEKMTNLIKRAKEVGVDLFKEINDLKSNEETDREIIDSLKEHLSVIFTEILIENITP